MRASHATQLVCTRVIKISRGTQYKELDSIGKEINFDNEINRTYPRGKIATCERAISVYLVRTREDNRNCWQ